MTRSSTNTESPAPIVSVVIPGFNYGRFIAQTLQSLRAQTFDQWECIVVDDGSTDDTADVVADAARSDPRIRGVRQPNRGQPAARNAGLAMARGRYIQLLDADDLLEPAKLGAHASLLDARPEVGIVYGSCRYFPTDRPHERRMSLTEPDAPWMSQLSGAGDALVSAVLDRNLFPINAALVRRSVFDQVGCFDETLARADDWDFWLRCAQTGVWFEYFDPPGSLALVRMHPTSLTRSNRRMLDSLVSMREKAARVKMPDELAESNHRHLCWLREVRSLSQRIDQVIPAGEPFILIDDERYRADLLGYPAVPFIERDGRYAGPPADDPAADDELCRLRDERGCRWAVITRPAEWHLQSFPSLASQLIEESAGSPPSIARVYRVIDAH